MPRLVQDHARDKRFVQPVPSVMLHHLLITIATLFYFFIDYYILIDLGVKPSFPHTYVHSLACAYIYRAPLSYGRTLLTMRHCFQTRDSCFFCSSITVHYGVCHAAQWRIQGGWGMHSPTSLTNKIGA